MTRAKKQGLILVALGTVFKAAQLGVLGMLIGFGVAGGVRVFLSAQGPVVVHLSAGPAEPFLVPRGGAFHVAMQYEKIADCPGEWAYFVRWHDSPSWALVASGPAGANRPGRYTYVHTVRVPLDAPLGVARMIEVVHMDCGGLRVSTTRSPEIEFEVIAAR